MTSKGMSRGAVERFGPQSLPGLVVWFVAGLVVVTHPLASAKVGWAATWGTARWVGYTAFADCGDPPPFDWMPPKDCRGPIEPAQLEQPDDGDAQADTTDAGDRLVAYGVELPQPERTWDAAERLKAVGQEHVIQSGGGR